MAPTRTATLMIVSLMLSLILSGIQSPVLHPSLMDHSSGDGGVAMHSVMSLASGPVASGGHDLHGSADPHAAHMLHADSSLTNASNLHNASTDHSLHSSPDGDLGQSADDCRLKCILAMCVSGSAVLSTAQLYYPREAAVMSASVPVFLSQSQPENPFRPPIAV